MLQKLLDRHCHRYGTFTPPAARWRHYTSSMTTAPSGTQSVLLSSFRKMFTVHQGTYEPQKGQFLSLSNHITKQ